MCGKARSTANPSKISSIVKNAMARHQAQNKPTDTTEQSNEQSNNDSALEAVDNIVPGMSMYVAYFNEENLLIVEEMKWGLYGFAGKTNGITYNSRIENIGSNFMSKKIKSNRGVVILDGFYEKYPDSFPKDYKQQSASMKSMIDKVTNLSQNSKPNN